MRRSTHKTLQLTISVRDRKHDRVALVSRVLDHRYLTFSSTGRKFGSYAFEPCDSYRTSTNFRKPIFVQKAHLTPL